MVSHRPGILDSEPRSRVAAAFPPFRELLKVGIVRRHLDLDGDQLVAALPVLGGEAAALEAQDLARARPLGNSEHDRAFCSWHLHLRAEHGLLEAHRKVEADVVPVAPEETV